MAKFVTLDEDQQVALYNALIIADEYTYRWQKNNKKRQTVDVAMKIAMKLGFPFSDNNNLTIAKNNVMFKYCNYPFRCPFCRLKIGKSFKELTTQKIIDIWFDE